MGASVEHAAPTISILGNDHLLLDACFLRKGMVVPIEVGAEIKFIISNGDSFTIILAMSISFSTVSIIPSALAIEVGWGLECIYSSCLPSAGKNSSAFLKPSSMATKTCLRGCLDVIFS